MDNQRNSPKVHDTPCIKASKHAGPHAFLHCMTILKIAFCCLFVNRADNIPACTRKNLSILAEGVVSGYTIVCTSHVFSPFMSCHDLIALYNPIVKSCLLFLPRPVYVFSY